MKSVLIFCATILLLSGCAQHADRQPLWQETKPPVSSHVIKAAAAWGDKRFLVSAGTDYQVTQVKTHWFQDSETKDVATTGEKITEVVLEALFDINIDNNAVRVEQKDNMQQTIVTGSLTWKAVCKQKLSAVVNPVKHSVSAELKAMDSRINCNLKSAEQQYGIALFFNQNGFVEGLLRAGQYVFPIAITTTMSGQQKWYSSPYSRLPVGFELRENDAVLARIDVLNDKDKLMLFVGKDHEIRNAVAASLLAIRNAYQLWADSVDAKGQWLNQATDK